MHSSIIPCLYFSQKKCLHNFRQKFNLNYLPNNILFKNLIKNGIFLLTAVFILNIFFQPKKAEAEPVDNAQPSITITCPVTGGNYSSNIVSVAGTASDDITVSKVEVKVGPTGTYQAATGTTSWSLSGVSIAAGLNTIYAKVTDTAGKTKEVFIQVTYNPANLVWRDEFSGLDTPWPNKFNYCWPPWPKTEASSANVYTENNALRFKISSPGVKCGKDYTGSGIGKEDAMYDRKYGYWEVRAKMSIPGDKRITGYILLYPPSPAWPPEIDFFETTGNPGDATRVQFTQHWGANTSSGHPTQSKVVYLDITEYHTYGVEITNTRIKWYVDGVLKDDQINNSPGTFWHPGAGIWACGWAKGPGGTGTNCDGIAAMPQYMDIDYIRIYDSKPTASSASCSVAPSSLTLKSGWNQLSSPIMEGIDLSTIENSCTLVPLNNHKLWSWNAQTQSWINPQRVEPFKGYWLNAAQACTVTLSGTPAAFTSVQLYTGWNKISASGSLTNIKGICNIVNKWIWNWDSTNESWTHPSTLQPDKGYWIKTKENCTLD